MVTVVLGRVVLGIIVLAKELYDRCPTNLEDLIQRASLSRVLSSHLVTHMLLPENAHFGLLKDVYGLKALKKECSP